MQTLQKMFQHMNWANERLLKALQNNRPEKPKAVELFVHVLRVEKVWLTRLMGTDSSSIDLMSEADLADCAKLVTFNQESYAAYLADLNVTALDQAITYRNMSGIEFTNSMRDILIHIALHGQYHRGQINALLRIEGLEPIDVDYITMARSI